MILIIIFSFLFSKRTTCGCRFSSPTMWLLGMGTQASLSIFPTLCHVHLYDLTSPIVTKDTDLISHRLEPLEEKSWSRIVDMGTHLDYDSCGCWLCHVGQVCETRSFVSRMRALNEQRSRFSELLQQDREHVFVIAVKHYPCSQFQDSTLPLPRS